MKPKFVHFELPLEEDSVIKSKAVNVPLYEKTIYDALGFFEDEIFLKSKFECVKIRVKNLIKLGDIINLHDEDGLKINKIVRMSKSLRAGKHILSSSGMPNIKLIITERGERVLFDGHHTLISYILFNKKYLTQVPHLIVESKNGFFRDESISVFFGKHSKKLKDKNWREYVINWNVPYNKQLSFRKRKNINELLKVVRRMVEG
jgi:hypothetical protein